MTNDIKQLTTLLPFTPLSFMEIGSRDGNDTKTIVDFWKIDSENCYVIEAYPTLAKEIKEKYSYNVYSFAASNINGVAKFNAVVSKHQDRVGMSSLLHHKTEKNYFNVIDVETKTMKSFFEENNLSIDLIKLDVEGHAYSVIEGFGDKIKEVKAIQIETEKTQQWENQKCHNDVKELLESFNFEMISIFPAWDAQYDCLFINKSL